MRPLSTEQIAALKKLRHHSGYVTRAFTEGRQRDFWNALPALLDAATRDAQVRAMRDEIDDFRQVKRVNGDTVTAALLDRLLAILDAAEPQE